MTTKIDYKKEWKHLYNPPKGKVTVVDVPPQNYLMIDGSGNPNTAQSYKDAVQTLYALSYGLRAIVKKEQDIAYTVMPLEGLWWLDDMGEKFGDVSFYDNKDQARWTSMILQPEMITAALVERALAEVQQKKNPPALDKVRFETLHEGACVQIMHIGSYDDELPNVTLLHDYIAQNGYTEAGQHHEIYLSNPDRVAPEKLKTVIRQPMREIVASGQ